MDGRHQSTLARKRKLVAGSIALVSASLLTLGVIRYINAGTVTVQGFTAANVIAAIQTPGAKLVVLPEGTYTIDRLIPSLRPGQKLRGGPGVVFNVTYRTNKIDPITNQPIGQPSDPILHLTFDSSIEGITFKYNVDATVTPTQGIVDSYPWAVRVGYCVEGWKIQDVRIVDGPKGIVCYGTHGTIRDVTGGCWHRGLVLDTCGHGITLDNICFNEVGWTNSNDFDNSPPIKWQFANGVAFDIYRVDGLNASKLKAARFNVGMRFSGSISPFESNLWWGSRAGGTVDNFYMECVTGIKVDWSTPDTSIWQDWSGKLGLDFIGGYLSTWPRAGTYPIEIKGGTGIDNEPRVHLIGVKFGPLPNPHLVSPQVQVTNARVYLTDCWVWNDDPVNNRALFLKADGTGEVSMTGGAVHGELSLPAVMVSASVRSATFGNVNGLKNRIQSQCPNTEATGLTLTVGAQPPDSPDNPPPVDQSKTVTVGPGKQYAEPHLAPRLEAGMTMEIYGRSAPYLSKLQIAEDNVTIRLLLGANGEVPRLEGANATEASHAKYWNAEFAADGIITVCPSIAGKIIKNPRIEGNGQLTNCRTGGAGFTNAAGGKSGWHSKAAGVAWYMCENPVVSGLGIFDNDVNVWSLSSPSYGTVKNALVEWCNIFDGGIPGRDREHNTYTECDGITYQFCRFGPPKAGSAGSSLKDRSAGGIVRYNNFEHGNTSRIIDIVDPEAGAAVLTNSPLWGSYYVYGNVIKNPTAVTPIHFGYDGLEANSQKKLYFYNNSCWTTGSFEWKSFWFKTKKGLQELYIANNIFHSDAKVPVYGTPAATYILTEEYASGTIPHLKNNWWTTGTQPWVDQTKPPPPGWATDLKGPVPGWLAPNDYRLADTSPAKGKAVDLLTLNWNLEGKIPAWSWLPDRAWEARPTIKDLGAAESKGPQAQQRQLLTLPK